MSTTTIRDCEDYHLFYHLEEGPDGFPRAFIHFDVHHWTAQILKQMLKDWQWFRSEVKCPFYAMGDEDDSKHNKFVRLFGFKQVGVCPCTDGKTRRIYAHFVD